MSTTYGAIRTYVMGQVWDDELKANVYAEHDTLKEALTGFPSLRPDADRDEAAAEVHRRADAKRRTRADLDLVGAIKEVLEADPALKRLYLGIGQSKAFSTRDAAGDELDRLARQRMTMMPGESYRQAFHFVMQANPDLKATYAKGE